jgi:hypothetical protein
MYAPTAAGEREAPMLHSYLKQVRLLRESNDIYNPGPEADDHAAGRALLDVVNAILA